jgi:translation initiation factor 2 beta subunit (eIF-2beta)/eIF-5
MSEKLSADYESALQRLQKQAVQMGNIHGNGRLLLDMNKTLKKRVRELEN